MNRIQEQFSNRGTSVFDIYCDKTHALGISIQIPDSEKSMLQIKCTHGLLLCKIFAPTMIEELKIPAALFSAPTFEEMLSNKPIFLSQEAEKMGATMEMTGEQLVKDIFSHD